MNTELLTLDGVAARTQQTRRTVEVWIKTQAMAHLIFGDRVYVRPCRLEEFLDRHEIKAVGVFEGSARKSDAGKATPGKVVAPGPAAEKPAVAGDVGA